MNRNSVSAKRVSGKRSQKTTKGNAHSIIIKLKSSNVFNISINCKSLKKIVED